MKKSQEFSPEWLSPDGSVRLFLGDCRQILPSLTGIDAIITDPPWGIGYRSSHNSGHRGDRQWDRWRRRGNFAPIQGDDQPFEPEHLLGYEKVVIWGANNFAHRLPPSKCWLFWDKIEDGGPSRQADGELAWTNLSGPVRKFAWLWRGLIRRGEENVSRSPKLHPNQKPIALMAWCVEQAGLPKVVCDPYFGSGTTAIACIRAGCRFIGMESDPHYFDVAVKRVLAELDSTALLNASNAQAG